jgi:hypothetical protein
MYVQGGQDLPEEFPGSLPDPDGVVGPLAIEPVALDKSLLPPLPLSFMTFPEESHEPYFRTFARSDRFLYES